MQLIKKNAKGYGYNYTDLAEITKLLNENGVSYYQYIEPWEGRDYIMTVVTDSEGNESEPIRGCRIVDAKLSGKDNPVQAYGASLTYARRYSLLMAFGLATTDDDAEGFTVQKKKAEPVLIPTEQSAKKVATKAQIQQIEKLCKDDDVDPDFIVKAYNKNSLEGLSQIQAYTVVNQWDKFRERYVSGEA